jgi:hypothetical protein
LAAWREVSEDAQALATLAWAAGVRGELVDD